MKRLYLLTALALLAATAASRADIHCLLERGVHCVCPPPPDCLDCCDEIGGHHRCTARKSERTCDLLKQLQCGCCCDRIQAAKKLGHRLHADPCCNPEMVPILIHALQCDTCWEVRRSAAWALAYQKVRTRMAVLAIYLASKADPHYMVRDAATDALEVLLLCNRSCYKDLFAAADVLAVQIRPYYQPTKGSCINVEQQCASLLTSIAAPAPVKTPEPLAAPQPAGR